MGPHYPGTARQHATSQQQLQRAQRSSYRYTIHVFGALATGGERGSTEKKDFVHVFAYISDRLHVYFISAEASSMILIYTVFNHTSIYILNECI